MLIFRDHIVLSSNLLVLTIHQYTSLSEIYFRKYLYDTKVGQLHIFKVYTECTLKQDIWEGVHISYSFIYSE